MNDSSINNPSILYLISNKNKINNKRIILIYERHDNQ